MVGTRTTFGSFDSLPAHGPQPRVRTLLSLGLWGA
jgi:hypothetical protein